MKSVVDRRPILPPAGRPHWISPEYGAFDLLYLSWGRRCYGKNPIPVKLHDGWTYLLIESGAPSLVLSERTVSLASSELLILAPDCAYGLRDLGSRVCSMSSWIWRESPGSARLEMPDAAGFLRLRVSRDLLGRIQTLHASSRMEMQEPDANSPAIVRGIRQQLDGLLTRGFCQKAADPMVAGAWRLHLAMEWLQKQIGATNPVQALCDYLQVSASTLNRLFYAHLGCSPQAHIHAARMEYALELARNHPIKEIAFLLGYKHSNDLSRALSRYRRRRGTVAGPLEGEGAPRKAPSGR